jgi:hypothetical protein
MFKGMSLSGKLYAGFSAVLLIATALGTFAYTRLTKIDAKSRHITADCLPGIFIAEEIQRRAVVLLLLPAKHILAQDKAETLRKNRPGARALCRHPQPGRASSQPAR